MTTRRSHRSWLPLAAAGLTLAGCAVGPNYAPPATPPHSAGPFVSTAPASATADTPPADWWRLYDDPALDGLVREALSENDDLKVAAANLANAEALVSQARAGLFPSTDVTADANYGKSSGSSLSSSSSSGSSSSASTGFRSKASWFYSTGFSAAYQVDLFGQIRRSIESARANAEAEQAAEDAVRVTVAAETAASYANACGFAEQVAVARRSLRIVQDGYDIAVRQRDAGALSDFDVARQATLLEQARAAIPPLEGQRRAALFELAALLGKAPADAPPEAAACQAPPRLNRPLPVGDGAALLKRRPDIRQADRQLASATAKIGVATAALYPSVTLGGSITAGSTRPSELFNNASLSYSVGPLISWSFPNTLVALAQIRQAKAVASGAVASFDSTVVQALKETEQALTAYGAELDRHAALSAARGHAEEAFKLAQIQYQAGTASYLDLLTSETTLVGAEQALAASDQALSSDQVTVFQTLGGGWEDAPAVVTPKVG
jgi:NodT family efflux transporter outer membrane factor (OMF) lipoprotein